jgi:hypothetical protein
MTIRFAQEFVTAIAVQANGNLVGHRTTWHIQGCLFAQKLGHLGLQFFDGWVAANYIIADLRRSHRRSHFRRRFGHRVASKVNRIVHVVARWEMYQEKPIGKPLNNCPEISSGFGWKQKSQPERVNEGF